MRNTLLALLATIAIAPAAPSMADELEVLAAARNMGQLVAANRFCGMQADQEKLRAIMERRMAEDRRFSGWFEQYHRESLVKQRTMSADERDTHCRQMKAFANTMSAPSYPDSSEVAEQLATILASEKLCELKFSEAGIQTFIDQNVAARDFEFAQDLSDRVNTREVLDLDIGSGERIARCAQIKRVARVFRFID